MKWTFKRILGLILAALFVFGPMYYIWITSGLLVLAILVCFAMAVCGGIHLILKLIFDD